MKKYISVLVVILLLGCVGCNMPPIEDYKKISYGTCIYIGSIEIKDISEGYVLRETDNFYIVTDNMYYHPASRLAQRKHSQLMIYKNPEKANNYRLWDDGDRVKEGKLVEGL